MSTVVTRKNIHTRTCTHLRARMHTYIYIFLYTFIYIYIDTAAGAGFSVNNRVNILPEFCLHSHNYLKINVLYVNKTRNGKIVYL